MALLAAEAPHFRHSHALHADFGEGIFDFLQLEVPDHGFNLLHELSPHVVLGNKTDMLEAGCGR
jgi:hypothetical protein